MRFLPFCSIALLSAIGFCLLLWITSPGVGVSPDSTTYIAGATNLRAGLGFSQNGSPVTRYPPLYSVFLAATTFLQSDVLEAARLLNSICLGLNVGLVALAVFLAADGNVLATICAGAFTLTSAPLLVVHSWAWSEPLFITISLASIIFLSMYAGRPSLPLLIASSVCLGLLLLTRYAGLAFLAVAVAIVFVAERGAKPGRRFNHSLASFVVACVPFGMLLVRNALASSATSRNFVAHPISPFQYFRQVITIAFDFVAPMPFPVGVRPTVIGLIATFFIVQTAILVQGHLKDVDWRSAGVVVSFCCFLYSASYLIFLFVSISFFDAGTPIDLRLLSPILVILTIGMFSFVWTLSRTRQNPAVWSFFLALVIISILVKAPDANRSIAAIKQDGLGYTSTQWRDSQSIAFIKALGQDVSVYSNGPDVVEFLVGKKYQSIPAKKSSITSQMIPTYKDQVKRMCEDIQQSKALLVYFDVLTSRSYLPTLAELESACHVPVLSRLADGTVLAFGPR